tara:strand:- start:509 stop:2296 length:1788 start_codon:yes stop_codon:yes gene_type:complete
MRGITSGLQPRRYADGDLVQKALDLGVTPFGMSDEEIMEAIVEKRQTDDISGASADFGEATEGFTRQVKENLFDYTDPLEYATLPFVSLKAAKLLGKPGKAVYNAVRGPADQFGGKIMQNIRGLGAYIGTDIFAREGIPEAGLPGLGYKNPFSNDAVDDAQKDVDEANKKEKDKDDENLTKEEKLINGLAALAENYASSQGVGSAPQGIAGNMIKGTAINTPEITRYQGGGIADMMPQDPMMMAGGGIAKFAAGKEVIKKGVKKVVKKTAKQIKAAKDKAAKTKATREANKAAKEAQEAASKTKALEVAEETASMPVRPDPKYLDFIAKASPGSAAAILASSKAAMKAGKGIKRNIKPILGSAAVASVPVGIAGGLYSAFSGDKDPKVISPKDSTIAAEVKLPDDSLKDILYNKSLARAQAAGREDPSFIDYVASFPGGFSEKSNKDPEFQRQMMAGFLAMMKPTEGFVPRNAFVDFGEAALAEKTRQEGEVPDQLKLIEQLSENPELMEAYKGFQKATKPQPFEELQITANAIAASVKERLYGGPSKKPILKKGSQAAGDPQPIDAITLYQMYVEAGDDASAFESVIAAVERAN